MAILRATAVLNKISGVPKDAARNVWHFQSPESDTFAWNAAANGLQAFYQALTTVLSPSLSSELNAHRIEVAEVMSTGPGASDDTLTPIRLTKSFQANVSTTGGGMPNEVAMALSFRGDVDDVPEELGSTRPRSMRRGRVFLGPLKSTVIEGLTPSFEPRITLAARETVLDAYDALHDSITAAAVGLVHVVYSRTANLGYPVEWVSVDNEPDTVRRRGRKASFKMGRSVTVGVAHGTRSGTDVALAS